MIIAVDSREQRPYKFEASTVVQALPVGDYSIVGLEDHIAIERKELGDLINCLCRDRKRFERELWKMKSLDYGAVVVEASLSDLVNGRYRSKMIPKSAIQSLLAFNVRYGIHILFCENRAYAERVTESLLQKYAAEIEKQYKHINTECDGETKTGTNGS